MLTLRNQKGVVLITAYFVVIILLGLSGAFFSRAIHDKRLVERHGDSLKAFYNAEKAVAYAYYESGDRGWSWFTHNWDDTTETAISNNLTFADAVRARGVNADCSFIISGADAGCYAANDGTFILKTFQDPNVTDITVVRAKGISGDIERVVEYRISRKAIYDFAWWTPYDLNINTVGDYVNGGRIHSNRNIYMYNNKRLYGVDTMSTGQDKGIYYAWSNYYSPGYYDYYADGSRNINGEVPLPHLDTPRRWAGTSEEEPYGTQHPWKYQDRYGNWQWQRYGNILAGTWPPRDWVNEEGFFYGDSQDRYNYTINGNKLNYYNTWLYPAQKDAEGKIAFDGGGNVIKESPEEIPAELDGAMWDWEKYYGFSKKFGGQSQQQLRFTVYDPDNPETPKYVEDTRWKIEDGKVVMTDDPASVTYWAMLENYDYWKAIGYSTADAQTRSTHINPEVLDGTYGSEVPAGQTTIKVDNTNSMKQQAAWNDFLAKSDNLKSVLLANERGEDMEAPRFATTYQTKSQDYGLYLSKSEGTHTLDYGSADDVTYTVQASDACGPYDPANPNAYWDCLEASIDVLVERLNTKPDGSRLPPSKRAARKVKFINCYTNKWNVVLELDLGKMNTAGTFPANGIIYSDVPIRLSNAKDLPYTADPKKATFNLISEENIYLKGDYNNPASDVQWMPSAIISKKQIYTLSDDFNDPQVTPAFVHYPNYPYVYVTEDADLNLVEADPNAGGGWWTYYGYFKSGTPQYQQAVDLRNAINSDWRSTFEQDDPTGSELYTVSSSHPIIDGQTWGAMPNRVQDNHTYNGLLASYYSGYRGWAWIDVDGDGSNDMYAPRGNIPSGVNLERWINDANQRRTKSLKGAYFQLDWGVIKDALGVIKDDPNRFTAHQSDGPLDYYYYAGFDSRPESRPYGGSYYGPYYLEWDPYTPKSYDQRLRNELLAQNKPIFFGGGESSWREIALSSF